MAASWSRLLAVSLVLVSYLPWTQADFFQSYCSNQNTGGEFSALYWIYQSNGWCHDTCMSQYSVAIVQGNLCWCSNAIPADTVSVNNCQVDCPGYPKEKCGNTDAGLFGYILIQGGNPTTVGASTPTSSTRPVSTPHIPPESSSSVHSTSPRGSSSLTVSATSQALQTTSSTVENPTSAVPESSSTPVTSSNTQTLTISNTPSPVTIVQTAPGSTRTVVITPTSVPDSGSSAKPSTSSGGSGVSTGTVVGIVLGVALGLGAVIGVGVWWWLRRRNQRVYESGVGSPKSSRGNTGIPSRQVSQMSSAGLLGKSPRILTAGLPPSNGPKSAESGAVDRRSLATDQRLNPYAIYSQEESRHSSVSLQDNQDYSRQLRIANPDP